MKIIYAISILFFSLSGGNSITYQSILNANDPQYVKGEKLYKNNCASCHSIDLNKRSTAPALADVTKKREKAWLYRFTRNSYKMIQEGDSLAVTLFNDNGKLLMTSFSSMPTADIDAIYYFIEKKSDAINAGKKP